MGFVQRYRVRRRPVLSLPKQHRVGPFGRVHAKARFSQAANAIVAGTRNSARYLTKWGQLKSLDFSHFVSMPCEAAIESTL